MDSNVIIVSPNVGLLSRQTKMTVKCGNSDLCGLAKKISFYILKKEILTIAIFKKIEMHSMVQKIMKMFKLLILQMIHLFNLFYLRDFKQVLLFIKK